MIICKQYLLCIDVYEHYLEIQNVFLAVNCGNMETSALHDRYLFLLPFTHQHPTFGLYLYIFPQIKEHFISPWYVNCRIAYYQYGTYLHCWIKKNNAK